MWNFRLICNFLLSYFVSGLVVEKVRIWVSFFAGANPLAPYFNLAQSCCYWCFFCISCFIYFQYTFFSVVLAGNWFLCFVFSFISPVLLPHNSGGSHCHLIPPFAPLTHNINKWIYMHTYAPSTCTDVHKFIFICC